MGLTEFRVYSKNKIFPSKSTNSANDVCYIEANEETTKCCGTEENTLIWCNSNDPSGVLLASIVCIMILFSIFVCVMLVLDEGEMEYNRWNGCGVIFLCVMALWSHLATMLGDPGAVPRNAKPLAKDLEENSTIMCGKCENFKPPLSHHCGVSGRCISRMDHFCPWTNNAIGAKNQKNFFLFLFYTNLASFYLYVVLALNLVDCSSLSCSKDGTDTFSQFVIPAEIVILLFAVIFTTSMIVTQIYSLATGLGTIDRMQLKRGQSEIAKPVSFEQVFGDAAWRYFIPVEPYFKDPESVYHYRIPGYSKF